MLFLLLLATAATSALSDETPFSPSNLTLENTPTVASAIDDTPEKSSKVEEAVWGEWTVQTPCTDTCGACGKIQYIRKCLCASEEGCTCSEHETREEVCATKLCQFPRHTCCKGYKKIATATELKCGPVNDSVEEKKGSAVASRNHIDKKAPSPITVKADTVWSDWIATTPCSDTCGACGKITHIRDCLCAGEEGCPCSGRETRTDACATNVCQFPRRTCCEGFNKVSTAHSWQCQPVHPIEIKIKGKESVAALRKPIERKLTQVAKTHSDEHKQHAAKTHVVSENISNNGIWSEWITSTPCSDSCGSCGTAELTRECLCAGEEGCPCSERQSRIDVCGTGLCPFPRRTCCKGFIKTSTPHGFRCSSIEGGVLPSDNVIVSTPTLSTILASPKIERDVVHDDVGPVNNGLNKDDTVWGKWTVVTPCTDTCGSCGRIGFTRECICAGEEGCPCRERETRVEVCASGLCPFPRPTCCNGYSKAVTLDGFKCAAEKDKERVCAGRWSPWKEIASIAACPSPCGMCGKRKVATRKCEPEGCECSGDTELFESCGSHPCREDDKDECCHGFVKGRVDGREECVPSSAIPTALSNASRKFLERRKDEERKLKEGRQSHLKQILPVLSSPSNCSWGEWTEVESECSGSCGMCGVRVSARRNCFPLGCNCAGPSTRYEDCGEGVCEDREKPCCGFYTPFSVNGVRTCVDPAEAVEERLTKTKTKRFPAAKREAKKDTLSTSTCRGIWSPFSTSAISPCDHVCGLCGHRSVAERQCIPEGCTCEGSNKLYERCGEKPCWGKKNGCCDGAAIVLVDGKRICKEIN